MENFEKLKEVIAAAEADAANFYDKGNNNVNNIIM
jgi:hypothetical protein